MAVATTQYQKMEDQKPQGGNNNVVNGRLLETKGANIPLWLLKTPPRVSRCLKPDFSAAAAASASDQQQSSLPVAKVVFCLDPITKTKEVLSSSSSSSSVLLYTHNIYTYTCSSFTHIELSLFLRFGVLSSSFFVHALSFGP